MKIISTLLVLIVILIHVFILILEMFFWNHPIGLKSFSMTPEDAKASTILAMNQGLYNGFLAAGLCWGLLTKRHSVILFFLACVITAGIFGAITAKPSILIVQALPAVIALIAVQLSSRSNTNC